ncbi:aldehyde dehydrogenase (NADP(+)) [Nocardioides mangrovicus]|uniref:Aldehyde dehydrogenase (NADP(+)) n=1 Tax=Nocardioides mangrovicus TaxID=2478913 RepID=A0A3L8P7N7_9ACTN|nr:aldehyde dehydrogenase (NADP(+)) [Nocardioides mangrovicus]RLV50967.1 aldehyde dehydrogenase (NADP(+)) [Nocardioides mangrovicus]
MTDLEKTLTAAAEAAAPFAASTPQERAGWLRAVADALDAAADELVPLAHEESHLPAEPRLKGELARTTFQLRLFADVLVDGAWLDATVDHADPDWPMGPRPDIRRAQTAIGPVLVFAASNFPFAFSVAGGDTASALAAGCPVVLKAHPGHLRLSERTGQVVTEALARAGAPDGAFAVIAGDEAGVAALRDPRIVAAAFTGSVKGGRALFDIAGARPRPIPFYGELGSLNPVVVTQAALDARAAEIAEQFAASFTMGAGQFCTKPGLLLVPDGTDLDKALVDAVGTTKPQPLLNDKIADGYAQRVSDLARAGRIAAVEGGSHQAPAPQLLGVTAEELLADVENLAEEAFGPTSVVATYRSPDELRAVLDALEPNLTLTVQAEESDADLVRDLMPSLQRLAGRLLWNQWPTGVTVTWAQQHGGPYPATTAPTTTSVGTAAIERFLRPVAWQGFPDALLPPALQEANPWSLPRRVDGTPHP